MKANLFLVISSKMDSNRKKDRNEDGLIRLGKKARENLGLSGETTVELWPDTQAAKDRINRSRLLTIHEAFSEDIKKLRESGVPEEDIGRAGFVTTKTFNYVCRREDVQVKQSKNIWLANSVEDTIIGGDPEFLLTYKDGYKYAAEISGLGQHDELGSDGPSVEVRPEPSILVEDMVKNISNILNNDKNIKKISNYGWVAGSYFYGRQVGRSEDRVWTLGGHIHLGTPLRIVNEAKANGKVLFGVFVVLKKILDELIAVPMMRVEGVEDSVARRQNSQYGRVEDIRTDFDRLEYRTIASDWLLHPDLATAVLGTAKAISHAYFEYLIEEKMSKDILSFTGRWYQDKIDWKQLPVAAKFHATRSMDQLRDILNNGEIKFDPHFFSTLRKVLRELPTYKDYKSHIDKFLAIVRLPEDVLRSQTKDLKEGWINNANYLIH